MKRFQLFILFFLFILVVGILMYRGYRLWKHQEPLVDRTSYSAKASLSCTNAEFRGDVVFVTSTDSALVFQVQTEMNQEIPQGYFPTPVDYQWTVTSGDVKADHSEASWTGASEGIQTITVQGAMKYLPPQPATLFSEQLPILEAPFHVSMKCLFPIKVHPIVDGKIHSFLIGFYPDPTNPNDLKHSDSPSLVRQHADVYQPPRYFYPVTPQTYRTRIFRDYTLGDFDLDPRFIPLEYPRYISIHPNLLRKLARLEDLMRKEGMAVTKFKIFYGFRSPAYNLGARDNDGAKTLKSPFSTHMSGLAVDMMIDENDDLVLDDLNQDGKITYHDAQFLLAYVDRLDDQLIAEGSDLVGGAGWYYHHDFWERGEYVQSPYVHMDARGFTDSYGNKIRWIGKDTIGIKKQKDPYRLKKPIPPWPW